MFESQLAIDIPVAEKTKIIIGAEAIVPKHLVNMDKLRKLLTVVSIDMGYGNFKVELWHEDMYGNVIIPRYYAMKVFSGRTDIEFEYRVSEGTRVDFPSFAGTLRPVQAQFAPDVLSAMKNEMNLGGLVNFAVGGGKTIFALYLASMLGLKTLVIVHKEFLMDQWTEKILGNPAKGIPAFLPGARVGRIQQNVCDVKDKHVVLGMVHSLAMKDSYPVSIYDEFGLVITDESHRMSAATFSLAGPKFSAKYRLALTATPDRKDGTKNVFMYHIGPMLAQYNVENLAPIIKRVFLDEVKFREGFNPDVIPMGRLMTMLGKHQRRNQVIANQIVDAAVAGRKSITMSHRLEQLDILKDYITAILKSRGMDLRITMGKYVGGMTQTALDNSATKDIILSTYTMASEGLDIPDLDTIFLATPMSSVLQSIGRILRACDEKKKPIVVDFIDKSIGLCVKMYKKRMKLYQSKGWK